MDEPNIAPGLSGAANSGIIAPPQGGQDVRTNWKAIARTAGAVRNLGRSIRDLRGQAAINLSTGLYLDTLYPFKIYQLPSALRATQDPANDWRKVRVRGGWVLGADATGTDGENTYTDIDSYPAGAADIWVPAGATRFWFWLELVSGGGAVARWNTDPTASSHASSENPGQNWTSTLPWTSAPTPDGGHVPIAWTDSNTSASSRSLIIRQLLHDDVVAAPSGSSGAGQWRGEYSGLSTTPQYNVGDLVMTSSGGRSGYNDAQLLGIWVCLAVNGATTSAGTQFPVYPYPLSPLVTYWHNISFPPNTLTVCDSGASKQFYTNASGTY